MKRVVRILCLGTAFAVAGPLAAGEGRIAIWESNTIITQPGRYVVTRDIAATSANPVIEIQASNVSIDLNGFTLTGAGTAVIEAVGRRGITIRNGTILGGNPGILLRADEAADGGVVIEDLTIQGYTTQGIHLDGMAVFSIRRNMLSGGPGALRAIIAANDVEPGAWTISGRIEDNQIRNSGGIYVRNATSVAVVGNVLEDITGAPGLLYEATAGVVAENIIRGVAASGDGIHILAGGTDNLVRDNVVVQAEANGLKVDGSRNHIERNVLGNNALAGMRILGNNNTYGRNTIRGNQVAPSTCSFNSSSCVAPDVCIDGFPNFSFGDNMGPDPGC